MLSSASSSSLPPNETRSLTLAEGRRSGWKKRTGEISLCGESEAHGIWAGVSSLSTGRWEPLPRKKTGGREGRDRSLKRKRCACAERRDWCSRSENNQNQRARHPHGISPGRKQTRCDRHRRAGETCTSRSNGAALERRFALIETYVIWSPDSGSEWDRNCCDAGVRWRRISRADRGRWVLLRGMSKASRLPDQCRRSRRRWRIKNLRILWRNDRLYSQMPRSAADPLVRFSTPARTNSRAVSLRD